jgi:hypothetical protein
MKIFSIRRDLDPFLMFSCRLDAEFNDVNSVGTVTVMSAVDEDHCYKLKVSVTNVLSFYYLGTEIVVSDETKSALIDTHTSTTLRTKPADFFISARRLEQDVVGLRARYQIKFHLVINDNMHELHSAEAEVRYNDYYQAEFVCEADI